MKQDLQNLEFPFSEIWIYKNPQVHAALQQGLNESEKWKISKIDCDFTQFINGEKQVAQ